MSQICRLFSGSNPVVGSSKKTIEGFPTIDIPKLNRLFIPPDNSLIKKFLNSTSFMLAKVFSTF